jgi:hypothetical protein
MPLFWGTPKQKLCRVTPQQCRTLFVLCALLCSPLAHSTLFVGVSPGDSCLETYVDSFWSASSWGDLFVNSQSGGTFIFRFYEGSAEIAKKVTMDTLERNGS